MTRHIPLPAFLSGKRSRLLSAATAGTPTATAAISAAAIPTAPAVAATAGTDNARLTLLTSAQTFGIPQALPASQMASAGPDWQTNPATQMTYIQQRYGSPSGAWAHEEAHNWY